MQNQEDQVLIDKFSHTGDQVWLARLFQKYEHLIYGICLKYSKDIEWSKDLKSQIYERLIAKTKGLKTEQFNHWLHTICKNHCLDEIRKKKRAVSNLDKFKKFQIISGDHVYFSEEKRHIIEQDEVELQKVLDSATATLSSQQQVCMEFFYSKRLSYLEISQETGMDLGQIKSHLQNGKRKMRHFVSNHYNPKI